MNSSGEYVAFISYASEDREKAEEICADLERRRLPCWIAPRDVRAGHEYTDEIIRGIELSAAMVVVFSAAANASIFVPREVERAVAKKKPLFPVRIADATPTEGLEFLISGEQWIDAWTGSWDDHMYRLARDLTARVRGTPLSRKPAEQRSTTGRHWAGGLAAAIALLTMGALALWSLSGDVVQRSAQTPPRQTGTPRVGDPAGPARVEPPAAPQPQRQVEVSVTGRISSSGPAAPAPSKELEALQEIYDDLSLRGGVVDDTLNQLWEEMKPLSPRLDMVTAQRRLKTNLARGREALAGRDVAGARKHLEIARADLAVLEQFLNR
jgi:TIR domain